jgi:hypothetical protein
MEDMGLQAMEMPKGITAEDVWAILRDTALQQKESDRKFREMSAATDKMFRDAALQLKETQRIVGDMGSRFGDWEEVREAHRETEKALKETQRIVGDLGNKFGDIAEQFLTPGLEGKFEQFGLFFEKLSRNVKWKNKSLNFSMEFDAMLENDQRAMIVEVKAKLTAAAVNEQIRRMERLRRYADERGERRQFYCAMAALTASDKVIDYTLTNGFYLILPSGEDIKITAPVPKPGIW